MPLFPPVITATFPSKRFMESPVFLGTHVERQPANTSCPYSSRNSSPRQFDEFRDDRLYEVKRGRLVPWRPLALGKSGMLNGSDRAEISDTGAVHLGR